MKGCGSLWLVLFYRTNWGFIPAFWTGALYMIFTPLISFGIFRAQVARVASSDCFFAIAGGWTEPFRSWVSKLAFDEGEVQEPPGVLIRA